MTRNGLNSTVHQAANRAAGIGDEQGRLPSRVKAAEVHAKCTICSTEIRVTKKNVEAWTHFDSRHPTSTFEICFPTIPNPKAVAATTDAASGAEAVGSAGSTTAAATAAAPAPAPKKKKDDLSFLAAALDSKAYVGGKKK